MTTGVALATPVSVVAVSDGARELLGPWDLAEPLEYSYRQSIYEVPVYEEFSRGPGGFAYPEVRSPDIRSIEYFGWRGVEPHRAADGLWAAYPPTSEVPDLLIRVTPAGQQRLRTARWTLELLPAFGETVVHVTATRRPLVLALLEGTR